MTTQQHRQARQKYHVERHPLAAGEFCEAHGEVAGQCERQGRAGECLNWRAGPVGRQGERRRRIGQARRPIVDVSRQDVPGEPLALPDRIVGVLNRQFGKRRWMARQVRRIAAFELPEQNADRPAIRDDVMHVDQQQMRMFIEPE